ncbi:MFS transporter, DHA1 family, bicyclomycin/chloramphenicol resistance protein [Streptoalloteichus tenebrarius]|uniref:MFS transporter, DHA1 family, bicyclomycin/chloramphenicol resistance protein n=1 Tax=Streptoalloteichus tenebrarius (strain ATCC 17920 / DSM 40477 / JCM 4838 / CBS 697.72 / NBRC 16177 / NCIMB 11028 / NRRL B-12390 / A12253. 1 / ISP 5477) TaxID=1933 RepID=A0ABT1HPW1_STRSD|nr:multidrug effflux MFS transporter [Streptoalloteichus tenebrarius]MCP2257551.1 MFS transporter, DHA1 family, bicyclomycin/chloramphenicol resistance protein [Streptoalloteichus tenebrarius]BFE98502.1 multidrug effflux MFS transporter [Streptoalloteichus tenebrarius]
MTVSASARPDREVTPPPPPARLTAALALLSFVEPLATNMYLPGFPEMTGELATDAAGVQLTLTAFLVGLAVGQLVLGPLSDRYGRRTPILVGTAVCTVATAVCAVAPTLEVLIALRFVMGFSGAAGVVVGRAVVTDVTSGPVAARIFGMLMALGGIAPIVAPLAGGVVVSDAGGWRAVFWVLAATSALMFLAALFFVPESLPAARRHSDGARGTLRAAASVLTNRQYLGYMLAFCLTAGALFCYIAASPFLFQDVLGFDVGEASVVFSAGALTATLSCVAAARLVSRHRPESLLATGLVVLVAASAAALAVTLAGDLTRFWALGLIGVGFLGLGQVFAAAPALALQRVPHAAGTGSAVLGTVQNALGAAVSPLMGIAGRHTVVPLFLGMTLCALGAGLALLLTRARPTVARPAVPTLP